MTRGESPSQNAGIASAEGDKGNRGQRRGAGNAADTRVRQRQRAKVQESRGCVSADADRAKPSNATAQEMRQGGQL